MPQGSANMPQWARIPETPFPGALSNPYSLNNSATFINTQRPEGANINEETLIMKKSFHESLLYPSPFSTKPEPRSLLEAIDAELLRRAMTAVPYEPDARAAAWGQESILKMILANQIVIDALTGPSTPSPPPQPEINSDIHEQHIEVSKEAEK